MTRVLHISPTDIEGGACLGAYKLHNALRSNGVDSRMLVLRKFTDDPSVVTRSSGSLARLEGVRDRVDRLLLRPYDWESHNWWSVGWLPFDLRKAVDRIRPDVVQFHWTGRGMIPIRALARLRHYPLLWTLRDQWPLTGGCHYAGDCEKFVSGCGACPQLNSTNEFDISRWQWLRKQRHWRGVRVTYVTLSEWMAGCARKSPLVFDNEIVTLPNGVDVDQFRPADKAASRAAWGLPADRRIILFGALFAVRDPRKGFAYLADALRRLAAEGWGERATAVVFGAASGDVDLGIPVRYVGHVRNADLASLYSAADVMVVPSIYENAAKTAIEALACGTPVAAFANTGQLDIVDHKVNGYLATDRSAGDLARGIAWCLDQTDSGDLSRHARLKATAVFDIRNIAAGHAALYERVLAAHRLALEGAAVAGGIAAAARIPEVLGPLLEDPAMHVSDQGAR